MQHGLANRICAISLQVRPIVLSVAAAAVPPANSIEEEAGPQGAGKTIRLKVASQYLDKPIIIKALVVRVECDIDVCLRFVA